MKVLVLGDGLLGRELIDTNGWEFLSRKKDGFDITDAKNFHKFGLNQYDVIVNCIAHTKTYSDERDTHWAVNYVGVVNLTNYCKDNNVRLVHISTDYIYAGSNPQASELDVPVHHGTWYCYTKLLGDAYVQLNENNLIIRTSHKPYPFPYETAWIDQVTNGDYVTVIANLITKLVEKGSVGVFNVGTEMKTWHSLTQQEFKTRPVLKPSCSPGNISMSIDKLNQVIK